MHSYARVYQPPNSHRCCPIGSLAPTPLASAVPFPPLPATFQPALRALGTHLPPGRGGALFHHPACTLGSARRHPHRSPAPLRFSPLSSPPWARSGAVYRRAEVGPCPTILPVCSDRLHAPRTSPYNPFWTIPPFHHISSAYSTAPRPPSPFTFPFIPSAFPHMIYVDCF
ncbi:hypothetical protein C8F04DRAFT_1254987 [Mycena alexandri]|uniref:Uncharacterized protein n=1 Tax=Mycena alexandri TaxID=1745969 RepID=A0AAD6T8I5_9AGAR|nr:hypothetical protein C8F04DRAFT_1254987 [Mycena alexandri]